MLVGARRTGDSDKLSVSTRCSRCCSLQAAATSVARSNHQLERRRYSSHVNPADNARAPLRDWEGYVDYRKVTAAAFIWSVGSPRTPNSQSGSPGGRSLSTSPRYNTRPVAASRSGSPRSCRRDVMYWHPTFVRDHGWCCNGCLGVRNPAIIHSTIFTTR